MISAGTLAFNPYILADFTQKQLEARVQLYFFRAKDDEGAYKGLNGGAFIGYKTDRDFNFNTGKSNFLVGIFFSGTFDLNKY